MKPAPMVMAAWSPESSNGVDEVGLAVNPAVGFKGITEGSVMLEGSWERGSLGQELTFQAVLLCTPLPCVGVMSGVW